MDDRIEELENATAAVAEALAGDDFPRLRRALERREDAVRGLAAIRDASPEQMDRLRRALETGADAVRRLILTRRNISLDLAQAGAERQMMDSLAGLVAAPSRGSLDCQG